MNTEPSMLPPLSPATIGDGNLAGVARYRPYPDYKEAGIEGLRAIPAHWSVMRLKLLANVRLSNVDKKAVEDQATVKLCNYVDVYYNEHIASDIEFMTATATSDQVRRFSLMKGDVLVTKDSELWTDIAVPSVVSQSLPGVLCGYHLAHIRPYRQCHGPFLSRAFAAIGLRDQYHVVANGITRFGLTRDAIGDGRFPLPSIMEQRSIATFLDRETARIDALMAKKESLIELLKEKRSSLVTHAVTKGIDSSVTMKDSGIDWMGDLPAHWALAEVRRRCIVIDCKHITVPFVSGGIPLASVRETQSFELDLSGAKCTTDEWYELLINSGRRPRPGDLIYCRNVSVGASALVTTEDRFAMGQDVCLIRSSLDNPRWLNHFFASSAMLHHLASVAVGSTFDRINISEIKSLLVPIVPEFEQESISRFLDCEVAKIDALMEKVLEAIARLGELRTALISAAVTGKIDVRETAA